MVLDIWNEVDAIAHRTSLTERAWRVMSFGANLRKLVESLEEQKILEDMIAGSQGNNYFQKYKLHPIFKDDFRAPPLKHGSRFGEKMVSSIWYGSLELKTAFAECSYYQFLFLSGSNGNYGSFSKKFLSYSINVNSDNALTLTKHPFSSYEEQISSPDNYESSQLLGGLMRENKIDVFNYFSARLKNQINIGVFSPTFFVGTNPNQDSLQIWTSIVSSEIIDFQQDRIFSNDLFRFNRSDFLINGVLPSPAV